MNLTAILGSFLLFLGPATAKTPPKTSDFLQQETPSAQSSSNTSANSSSQAPEPQKRRRHKKTVPPDCTNAPAPLNAQPGSSSASTNEAENPSKTPQPASADDNANAKQAASAAAGVNKNAAAKPCPSPKKVVRNGGSDEPAIKLTGGTVAGEAAEQRSTEQLTSIAEANLKKISGRELNPNQKQTVNQIQEFLQQSRAATAAGNAELAHNFAQKAQLLSEELANAK